jgi:hypothetical protein
MDNVQTQILGLVTHTLGDTKACYTLGIKVERTWGHFKHYWLVVWVSIKHAYQIKCSMIFDTP